jgi:hypothetical protein
MEVSRRSKMRGGVAILLAVIAVNRAILWGRGTPAFVAGAAAGLLLLLGILLLSRKD